MTQLSSLYLHVPFCQHLCNYCDFYKRKLEVGSNQFEEFHQFLKSSWQRHATLMKEHQFTWSPMETIYLGGGTPSLWGKMGSEFFAEHILSHFTLRPELEFTMEVDPGAWTPELIDSWKSIGMNRISIGTQTLNPTFLTIMDRAHSKEESLSLLKFCQENNWNYSLDFLLGLPFSKEKVRDIRTELDELLSYRPRHVSLYILNARSKYPHTQNMPDDEFIREEYLLVSSYLQERGFHHYEVSNFALPGFESQHNIKYWKSESVAALGPTGTGLFKKNSHEAIRYKWKVSAPEVEIENLGFEELNLEKTYLELRTSEGWRPENLTQKMKDLFNRWEEQKYGQFQDQTMRLNSLGFLMLDSLMDDLFRLEVARLVIKPL